MISQRMNYNIFIISDLEFFFPFRSLVKLDSIVVYSTMIFDRSIKPKESIESLKRKI